MGFGSLQHIKELRSTARGPKPARYVPSSGFGYPRDGLLPQVPCRFCFTPAALMGFTLRRFPLPQGSTAFQPGRTCLPLVQRYSCRTKRQIGPPSRGFQVYACQDCLATAQRFRLTATGASLGFCPSRARHCEDLVPDFSGMPLSCLTGPVGCPTDQPAPQSIDQPSPRLARPAPKCQTGRSSPSGVPAPARSRPFESPRARAMEFTSRRVMHCC
jgi:hypothetical protein